MATNGNNTPNGNGHNGNGRSAWKNISAESFGFGIAELVSMGVSLGVVGIADQVAPSMLQSCSKTLGKILEPYLDTIENGLKSACKLEECQPDLNKPREERAQAIAKTMIVFSAAWATSMTAKFATRRYLNRLVHIEDPPIKKTGNWLLDKVLFKMLHPNEWRIAIADEGVHYGALALLNTSAAGYTDDMIHSTSTILHKCGIPEKKAKELASMAVIWELPNFLGMLSGTGAIIYNHLSGSKANHPPGK